MEKKRKEIRKMKFSGFETDIEQIKAMYDDGEINLNPEYQRNGVWTIHQKQALIDSILNYELIGLILFNKQNNGIYDVVDGQQRLRAIFEFIDGEFSTDPEITNGEPLSFEGIKNDPDKYHEFCTYPISSNVLTDYNEDMVSDFFIKINSSTNLSFGEKIHAINSYLNKQYLRKWPKHELFKKIKLTNYRRELQTALLEIFYSEVKHYESEKDELCHAKQLPKGKGKGGVFPASKQFVEEYKYKNQIPKIVINKIEKNLDTIMDIFEGEYGIVGTRKGYFIIIYYFCSNLNSLNIVSKTKPSKNEIKKFLIDFLIQLTDLKKRQEDHKRLYNGIPFSSLLSNEEKDLSEFITTRPGTLDLVSNLFIKFMVEFPTIEVKDSRRFFDYSQKLAIYKNNEHKCGVCGDRVNFDDAEFDHIKRHSEGGKTIVSNGQVICKSCHVQKTISNH